MALSQINAVIIYLLRQNHQHESIRFKDYSPSLQSMVCESIEKGGKGYGEGMMWREKGFHETDNRSKEYSESRWSSVILNPGLPQ